MTLVDTPDIKIFQENDVARIAFNNEMENNGLTLENIPAIASSIRELGAMPSIKAIVLSGTNKVFCSGGSMRLLNYMRDVSHHERMEILNQAQQIVREIKMCGALVVAEVEGLAAGAGVDIALSCDLLYTLPTVRLNWSFTKMNLIPDLGGLHLLKEKLGHSATLQFLLQNSIWKQRELSDLQLGIGIEKKPASLQDWREILRKPTSVSKEVISHAKNSLWASEQAAFEKHLKDINDRVCQLMDSERHRDMMRRTAAFQKTLASGHAT